MSTTTETGWAIRDKRTGHYFSSDKWERGQGFGGDAAKCDFYDSISDALECEPGFTSDDDYELVPITRTITVEIGEPETP